jgi:uncharacterized alpha-E superfamily protein
MLQRVAENLYWIGRYIERAEYTSRFIKVQYFSTLEAPMLKNKDFALRSIVFITGSELDHSLLLEEELVWSKVLFSANNPNSIANIIKNARENARSIRNTLSQELWEAINKLYHYSREGNNPHFTSSELFEYSEQLISHIAVVKFRTLNSILHDDVFHFIVLGRYIERILQILNIIRTKISDWEILSDNGVNQALVQYQWTILLKSLEGFDIYNRLNKEMKSHHSIFQLLFSNTLFPRSIAYTSNKILHHLDSISAKPLDFDKKTKESRDCLNEYIQFDKFSDQDKIFNHIDKMKTCITEFHTHIYDLYFH